MINVQPSRYFLLCAQFSVEISRRKGYRSRSNALPNPSSSLPRGKYTRIHSLDLQSWNSLSQTLCGPILYD